MQISEALPGRFYQEYADFTKGKLYLSLRDEITLSRYRMHARNEMERLLGGRFWISPDLAAAQDVTIGAYGSTFIPVVIPESLSPFTDIRYFHPYAFSVLYTHTRSRYAQLGLEVNSPSASPLAQFFHEAPDPTSLTKYQAYLPVTNHAARPIKLSKGERFFCLYYWDGRTITGQNLMDRIGQQIQIKGQENVDWRWWYPPYLPDDQKYVAGIEFVIDPHSRAWIPPGKEPIQIADGPAANHSRTTVDQYLQRPVPQLDNDSILCIAETLAELTLDPSVHGLVDMCVARNGAVIGSHDTHDFQTNSVLLQGGNTYDTVRTETFSPTTPNKIAQTALIRFVRAW